MTSKTSRTTPKISLILDKEFIRYCELNEIEDIKKLAKETFKRGFDLLKYGNIPSGELTSEDQGKVDEGVYVQPLPSPLVKLYNVEPSVFPEIVEAVPMKSSDAKEVLSQMGVKPAKENKKKDLYDE